MPVWVHDFSWEQTSEAVRLTVPLRAGRLRPHGLFCTERYLKVNAPPLLFEAALFAPIDAERSRAEIRDGCVVFTLLKKEAVPWASLRAEDGNEAKMREIREEAVLQAQEEARAKAAAKSAEKRERGRFALDATIKLEEAERKRIEELKEQERKKSTEEIEAWKRQNEMQKKVCTKFQLPNRNTEVLREIKECQNLGSFAGKGVSTSGALAKGGNYGNMFSEKIKEDSIPSPRPPGSIMIHFTPRVFPTALRESRIPEEEEWLCKQAEARRIINADIAEIEDLKEEEKNPEWLKDKGNKMFETGNYLAAVNAYNLAIRINNQIPTLYLNRAACHLRLRNLHKVIEDASQALELLTPPVSNNAKARLKAHLRRGTAFCELELYTEGLQDYLAALKIEPTDKNIGQDVEKIRRIIQGNE
ncbi:dynein assembly factor 4, axonemal [Pseudonaja textilis]|uniref:Dynein axonemal assembly factor 4 n=1 Tax=Pseudonaja textilis TaxID=8673 RepID=A0A670XVD6_PSETE|nr:dynein assembly factor 4, axonemal [Pseudonaja textilis]